MLTEAQAGYVTQKIISTKRAKTTQYVFQGTLANGGRLGWNFKGVWFLKSNGDIIQSPDFNVFAPGYYPSPNATGQYELWTGEAWAGIFRSII